jgi:hypothetical protein
LYAAFFACLGFVEQRDEKGVRTIPEQKLRFDQQACGVEHGGASRDNPHKPALSRRKDRQPDPAAPAGCGSKVEHASTMLPKHQQHRKHREQIGRKPADEPGLDLEHARIASSKASHALTSSIGKGMAGNVATFYSTTKVLIFL